MGACIKLYNTLSRKKEAFNSIKKGHVGIYTCGPTVYSSPTVGNMRTYIFSDLLKRVFLYNGFSVRHIINVTDVGHLTSDADSGEDKIEKAARKERKTAREISGLYFSEFREDFRKLKILSPDKWPKASEHVGEQIDFIKKLEKKGYTYKTRDGIYFDSGKFRTYGELITGNIRKGLISPALAELKPGSRVKMGDKKNKTDFALWKFSSKIGERQQEWDSPWGIGFPGWHIECSAMSMKYLGRSFDIHTGGEDHKTIHHTNEIAQSEALTGKKFVNYWLHSSFLLSKGEKISKSKGGLYTVSELEDMGYSPMEFRYLCLLTHYRRPLNFSFESLDSARNAYEKIRRKISEARKQSHKGKDKSEVYKKRFLDSINDDLNIPKAMEVFWKAMDDFDFSPRKKINLLEEFDSVLGIGIKTMSDEKILVPKDVKKLIEQREKARKEKKWEKADILREKIKIKGFIVEDFPNGFRVRKV